jgi:hypothetical protein
VSQALILAPEAEAEIAEAREWYDERRPGLGNDFVLAIGIALARIKENPLQYQNCVKAFSSRDARPFSVQLVYSATDEVIRVVALRPRQT